MEEAQVQIEQIFTIIAQSGEAKGNYYEAFRLTKDGKKEEAEVMLDEAEKALNEAHKIQTELIVKEANGEKTEIGILMVHAQDHLMNSILVKELIEQMISMQKEINEIKGIKGE